MPVSDDDAVADYLTDLADAVSQSRPILLTGAELTENQARRVARVCRRAASHYRGQDELPDSELTVPDDRTARA